MAKKTPTKRPTNKKTKKIKAPKQIKKTPQTFIEKCLTIIETNPLLLISLVIFAVYGNTLFNGFVWDDEEQIVNNVLIHSLKNFSLFLYGGTFNMGGTQELSGWFFRPMVNITFALLYSIFKLNAWGYHLFSILIHLLNSVLIFKILEKLNAKNERVFPRIADFQRVFSTEFCKYFRFCDSISTHFLLSVS